MYKEYFFLTGSPFLNTPDPAFLYGSRSHKETLASMAYGVLEGKGFVLVTGDVGSGKTLLAQSLKRELDGHILIEITNPWATPEEVLAAVQTGVGLKCQEGLALWDLLKQKLIELAAARRRVVLIIDEAQQLPERTLEGLCLLSNLETATEKLIQIVLIGQGELATILSKHSLRHLYQRITLRACLQHLNRDETVSYIQHRLRIVGGSPLLFPADCIDLIFQESQGTPRVINNLCDKCLLFAFGRSSQQVTLQITKDAICSQWPELGLLEASEAGKISAQAPGANGGQYAGNQIGKLQAINNPASEGAVVSGLMQTTETTSGAIPSSVAGQPFELPFGGDVRGSQNRAAPEKPGVSTRKGFGFKHLLLTLLLGIVLGGVALNYDQIRQEGPFPWLRKQSPAPAIAEPAQSTTLPPAAAPATGSDVTSHATMSAPQVVVADVMRPVFDEKIHAPEPLVESASAAQATFSVEELPLPGVVQNPLKSREEKTSSKNTIEVLAARYYGAWNESTRDLLIAANPQLTSFDKLPAGTKLQFPALTRESLVVKDTQGQNFVYFGSFDKLEFAQMNLEAIKRSFSGAQLSAVDRQGVKLHRLFVGPFVSQSEAQAVANSLWFKYLPILN